MLDYTLQTIEERLAVLQSLDLENCKPAQLENYANYLLHLADPSLANHKPLNNAENKKNNKLTDQGEEIKPAKGSNRYLYPTKPVPWEHPNLRVLKEDIGKLLRLEEEAKVQNNTTRAYQLHRWITELRLDAKARISDHEIQIHGSFSRPMPTDLEEAGLNWTNSFHIKHLVRHYSNLKQDDNAKFDAEYLEQLIEETPLPDWKKHILIRYIDGTNTIIVAREVAEQYGKVLYPGFISKVMRSIYRAIATTAEKKELERTLEKRKCPKCGQWYPDHQYWWRKGQRKCKVCLSTNTMEEVE